MADVISKLEEISYVTHTAQNLLEYVLEDIDTGEKAVLANLNRIASTLDVLQSKLCELDGLQQCLLSELTEKENALDGETNTIQGQ